MARLTIHEGETTRIVPFDAPARLADVLLSGSAAIPHPCGGRGSCGKCSVALSGDVSTPNEAEVRCGTRLSCQAVLLGNADVTLLKSQMTQIAQGSGASLILGKPQQGRYGAAIDIGTTTLALAVYDLQSGARLGAAAMENPQRTVAVDVIGRMDAAMKGQDDLLQSQVTSAIQTMLQAVHVPVDTAVITGNTTMLYLLTGRDPACMSRAPFAANHLFGEEIMLQGISAYLPVCLHAFVGADTTCALLASGMVDQDETTLLVDVGTNGEMALWHGGMLYVASTAAGPAFEGAGIRYGCAGVDGAIDRCTVQDGRLICRTIGGKQAVGICGSGLVDVLAALMETQQMDETGALDEDEAPLRDGIAITQADIRAVQLAKAAIHAGMLRLMQGANVAPGDIRTVYLAGGFGQHLNIRNAAKIGLFPAELADRVQVIGNAALDGAALLLGDTDKRGSLRRMSQVARHVRLDGDAAFAQLYVDAMLFGDELLHL